MNIPRYTFTTKDGTFLELRQLKSPMYIIMFSEIWRFLNFIFTSAVMRVLHQMDTAS